MSRRLKSKELSRLPSVLHADEVGFDWAQLRAQLGRRAANVMRSADKTRDETLIRTDTRKEKSDFRSHSFVLPENSVLHNSLLMDVAAKLISTLIRRPARAAGRHAKEKTSRNKEEIFSCLVRKTRAAASEALSCK